MSSKLQTYPPVEASGGQEQYHDRFDILNNAIEKAVDRLIVRCIRPVEASDGQEHYYIRST